jgi:hypothetical protein
MYIDWRLQVLENATLVAALSVWQFFNNLVLAQWQ